MKLPFKSVEVRTFVHATESTEKIKEIFELLISEEIEINEEEAKGHYGDQINIISARIDRRPDLRGFWRKVLELMPDEDKKELIENALDRIADDCRLYLRFDKQAAVNEELILTDSGDALHVRINISAYPAKKSLAIEEMRDFISSGLEID
ncbi:MAG: hypothetical protein KGY45_02025 [Hadesarchaea archaeon]|nr:hypothetical protein [Hadesarchaea archaeon]